MAEPVPPDDYDKLVGAMNILLAIRDRSSHIETMFEPLHDMIAVLRRHNIKVSEDLLEDLENAPYWWDSCKKLGYNYKSHLQPLQAKEIVRIKTSEMMFDRKVCFYH